MDGEIIGAYRVIRTLGRGGMGVTFEAERLNDGLRVALKELQLSRVDDWKVLELFEREARVLSNITHPNVPAYIDHFKIDTPDGPTFYLVQQLATGRSLAQRATDGWRADEATAKRVAEALLDVLEYLHARNPPVFHRDIKPQNVLLDELGKVWLVDFGSVRDVYKTTAGGSTVAGTFGYMAPEQLRGVARPESDLYGLGATILFMLSGQSPGDMPQVKLRIDFERRVRLSPPMRAWLAKMLEPAPEDRFPTARRAILALRDPAIVKSRRRTPFVLAAVLGAVLIGGAAFVAFTEWRERHMPSPATRIAGTTLALPKRPQLPTFPALTFVRSFMSSNYGVRSMTFTPDGKMLLTASGDGTLKLWDASTGESLRALPGHTGEVAGVGVTPDGHQAVSAGDHTIRVWSMPDGKPVRTIDAATPKVFSLALSPNGQTIVTGGAGGVAKVWTLDGSPIATLPMGTPGRVLTVAFSPDGSRVITGGDDKQVRAWTTSDWKLQRVFVGHKAPIDQVLVAPDGQTLVSSSDDHTVELWHLESGHALQTLSLHTDEVWSIAVSPDGGTLMTGGKDARLGVWSLPFGKLKQEVALSPNTLTPALAFSPDGVTAASGHNGVVYLWRLARNTAHAELPAVTISAPVAKPMATPEQRAYAETMQLVDSYNGRPEMLDQAETKLKAMLAANPRSALAYAGLGHVAYARGMRTTDDYDPAALKAARAMADKAIEIDPSLADAYRLRGSIAYKSKELGTARAAAMKALELDPKSARLLLADIQLAEGDLDGTEKTLRAMLATPLTAGLAVSALQTLAEVYEKIGDYEAEARAYTRQIEIDPGQAWLKGNYAGFLIRRGDYDGAIAMAKKALAQMDYGAAHHVLAHAHCAKGEQDLWDRSDPESARKEFDAAVVAVPSYARAAYDLGAYHQYLGKMKDAKHLDDAKVFYAKAASLDPKDPLANEALAALN
jgi:WD40 repeat protein/Tfp pilus assembly protein PilF